MTNPMDTNKVVALLQQQLPVWRQKYPIQSLALFGSYSRNEATEESDIDLLITFSNNEIGYEYLDLYFDLQQLFGNKKIDLVTPAAIQPHYWPFIKEDLYYV